MASSSSSSCSSSLTSKNKYDVFLSFRGKDTRDNFISHLYTALCRKQIKTFIDDEEVRRGDEISLALLNAIENSKISVIVFSKNYGSSKWCLNELVKILQCHKMNGQMVVPVFYHVNPSEVRNQNGSFENAFIEHEKHFKNMPEKVLNWRTVLTQASNLSGWTSQEIRFEAQLVDLIVKDILKKLEKITVSTNSKDLVGLNSRIMQIKSLLCMELSDIVQIVGIWGMGGIGKTTLATTIFNQFSFEFGGKCFMEDVRRKSETGGGLKDLQKQIFSTIVEEKLEGEGSHIPQFTKERVRRMKVFIVLDDVNKVGQLNDLIGGLDQYGPGSRIVVTTRDRGVLEKFGVKKIYSVNGLKNHEAFEQFCNYAFKENHCPKDLIGHSWRFVVYGKGNPLALKVLGSSLHQKNKLDWENALDNLNDICRYDIHDIYGVLKISFNELTPKEKSLFLDIACFFVGEDKDFVTKILDDSNSYGLDFLIDKSLITISNNCLQMHDLLQEMGREIICEESVNELSKRTRLWYHKDVRHILKHNKGTEKIEGIFLDLSKTKDIHLDSGVFANMSNLRQLKFYVPKHTDVSITTSKVHLDQGLEYLPKELRYLYWHQYPLKTLPSNFKPKNLIELSLPYSKVEQLWKGKKKAFKLKSINLRNSQYLVRMPDLSDTPNLERTILWNCTNLACVPSSIQNFNHLRMLCLKGCKSLRSFPSNICFNSPITIDFSCCVNLAEFPQISGNVIELNLSDTAIEEGPSSIQNFNHLRKLCLKGCKSFRSFLGNIHFGSPVTVDFSCCVNLVEFPPISGNVIKLDCGDTAIKEVPSSIECLADLKELRLSRCTRLKTLSTSICKLKSLLKLHLDDCLNLKSFPEILEKMEHLKYICLERTAINELPSSIENLEGLESLDLERCFKLDTLPDNIGNLKSLKNINGYGSAISQLPSSILDSNVLLELWFPRCRGLVSLPPLSSGLSSLVRLDVSDCALVAIPRDIGTLSSLKELDLSRNNFGQLPTSIKQLSQLIFLRLNGCNMLQSVPELPLFLNYLDASDCNRLQYLPEIPPCPEELDTSILERLSNVDKYSLEKLSHEKPPSWINYYCSMECIFTNCMKLNEKANNKIFADSQLRIQQMAIASLRLSIYEIVDGIPAVRACIFLPGSEIPGWFKNRSSGSPVTIQLPQHCCSRNLIGFAFCAVFEFEGDSEDTDGKKMLVASGEFEVKTLSKSIRGQFFDRHVESIESDHVILGFNPIWNIGLPDGNHHTTVTFYLSAYYHNGYKVKCWGVCPVFVNPNETNPNTSTLKFVAGTEIRNLDDKAGTRVTSTSVGRSDEEELEPSHKRTCR